MQRAGEASGLVAVATSQRARRDLQARALSLMFAAGASMALLALALPHGEGIDVAPWAINASLGFPVAAVLLRWGPRLPDWSFHVVLVVGACIVALGMSFGNGGTLTVAAGFFYIWVALYVFIFFPAGIATAHLVFAAVLLAVVLPAVDTPGAAAVWLLISGTAAVVGLVTGLTRRELSRLATTDHLTGLPNRRRLAEVLDQETARASRNGAPFCVAALDVDGLKAINDNGGHQAGDDALRAAADAWREALRPTDVLVRYGGDEFVVVLPGCELADASHVVARLTARADVGCSVGLACWRPGDTADDLVRRADASLYRAKHQGRGQLVCDDDLAPGTGHAVEEAG